MSEPRRIRITHIHENDACYSSRDRYIGKIGLFTPRSSWYPGYYSGWFESDDKGTVMTFVGVRYVRV